MPILHLVKLQVLQCTGCEEVIEIRRQSDPEELAALKELAVLEHEPCDKFRDAHQAKMARKFRKKLRLRNPHGEFARAGGLR